MDEEATVFWFNVIEAGFWMAISLVIVAKGWRSTGRSRIRAGWAAVSFGLFGISDVIEAHTGAWWEPWWLFVLKTACVLSLLACLVNHFHDTSRRSAERN